MNGQNRPRPAFCCPQASTIDGCGHAELGKDHISKSQQYWGVISQEMTRIIR